LFVSIAVLFYCRLLHYG